MLFFPLGISFVSKITFHSYRILLIFKTETKGKNIIILSWNGQSGAYTIHTESDMVAMTAIHSKIEKWNFYKNIKLHPTSYIYKRQQERQWIENKKIFSSSNKLKRKEIYSRSGYKAFWNWNENEFRDEIIGIWINLFFLIIHFNCVSVLIQYHFWLCNFNCNFFQFQSMNDRTTGPIEQIESTSAEPIT